MNNFDRAVASISIAILVVGAMAYVAAMTVEWQCWYGGGVYTRCALTTKYATPIIQGLTR